MAQLILAAFFLGFSPLLVKAVHLGPTAIGFYRCALAALFILPIVLIRKSPWQQVWRRRSLKLLLAAGLFFALDLLAWHRSIQYVGAGMGTLLANTQAIYLAIYSAFIAREKVSGRLLLAMALAFLGIFQLVNLPTVAGNDLYLEGVLWGLSTGLSYSLFLIYFRKVNLNADTSLVMTNVFMVSAISAAFLFLFSLSNAEVALPSGMDWLWLVLLSVVVHFVGWLMIMKNINKVPLAVAGLILMLQPALAIILSRFIYEEPLTWKHGIGSAITLVGVYLGSTMPAPKMQQTDRAHQHDG